MELRVENPETKPIAEYFPESNLLTLPQELLIHIFSFFDKDELVSLELINKKFCLLSRDESLWKRIVYALPFDDVRHDITYREQVLMVNKFFSISSMISIESDEERLPESGISHQYNTKELIALLFLNTGIEFSSLPKVAVGYEEAVIKRIYDLKTFYLTPQHLQSYDIFSALRNSDLPDFPYFCMYDKDSKEFLGICIRYTYLNEGIEQHEIVIFVSQPHYSANLCAISIPDNEIFYHRPAGCFLKGCSAKSIMLNSEKFEGYFFNMELYQYVNNFLKNKFALTLLHNKMDITIKLRDSFSS